MKLDQLQYFVVAAQTQHIGKASKILNVSPSAISHSIRNLEDDLGQKLFEKSGKNIHLTHAGKQLCSKAGKLLKDAADLRLEFRSPNLPLQGSVKIAATHGLSNFILMPSITTLQRKHPGLMFQVYSLRSAQVIEMVANGEIDIGLCFSPNPHPSIVVQTKLDSPLTVAVRPRHPILKVKERERASALSRYPLCGPISFAGIDSCEDHPSIQKAGVRSDTVLATDSYEVSAAYLKRTTAWCLMPRILVAPLELKAVDLPEFQASASVAIICPKGRKAPELLLRAIRDELGK